MSYLKKSALSCVQNLVSNVKNLQVQGFQPPGYLVSVRLRIRQRLRKKVKKTVCFIKVEAAHVKFVVLSLSLRLSLLKLTSIGWTVTKP